MTRLSILLALVLLAGCGLTPERVYRVGGDVTRPERISAPRPSPLAELAGSGKWQIGLCVLGSVITAEGEVRGVKLLKPSSIASEVERALRAEMESWRFKPATRDGRPVSVHYNVMVDHCPLRPIARTAG